MDIFDRKMEYTANVQFEKSAEMQYNNVMFTSKSEVNIGRLIASL